MLVSRFPYFKLKIGNYRPVVCDAMQYDDCIFTASLGVEYSLKNK
jgi:hypothetical protein